MVLKKLSLKKDGTASEKSEFVNAVEKSLKTPVVPVKYCYLVKPFFYPGSHVPRYSLTLLFDKSNKQEKAFLESMEVMAKSNGVETLGYLTDSGLISLKFQTKNKVKTYIIEHGKKTQKEVDLEHDVPEGFNASVMFELNTYFNKKTQKKGFNFCPKKVVFHLDEEDQQNIEMENDGNNKSSGNRSGPKVNGVRNSKLQPGKKRGVGKQLRGSTNTAKVQRG